MSDFSHTWATQQLSEFVAAVTTAADEALAIRVGVEHAAEALDADAVALIRDGVLRCSVGWPAGQAPVKAIEAATRVPPGRPVSVPVLGLGGGVPATVVAVGEGAGSTLVVARADSPLDAEEKGLLRAMARTLGLALRNHEVLGALRQRQRLLEGLSEIQRSIAGRRPLRHVLDAIVALARELLDDDQAVLALRDQSDPERLTLVASTGLPLDIHQRVRAISVGDGAIGRAVMQAEFVVIDDYQSDPGAVPELVAAGLTAGMAAPVHEDGKVVGGLAVSSYVPGRTYSPSDQSLLQTLAEHATLALSDAKAVSDIIHQALHDPLTGLANRELFGDRLAQALLRSQRSDHSGQPSPCVGVLFIDLDRFKSVNDRLGHAVGDQLLSVVGERIVKSLRPTDTAARLGGDEFAVLLEDLRTPKQATDLAQRVIDALLSPITLVGREVIVGASVGVALGRDGTPDDLLSQADVAMYQAKELGKGRFVLYEPRMRAEASPRLELEDDLHHALRRHELELVYQPMVELGSTRLRGVEALIRWNHPLHGVVGSEELTLAAQETGLAGSIGRWALEEACRQMAAWRRAGADRDILLSVKLYGRQFEDPDFVSQFGSLLTRHGVGSDRVVLEIAESALMHDPAQTASRLRELRAIGVLVCVDDFGTGPSTLSCLSGFPVYLLKMARTFVEPVDRGPGFRALAQTICDLGAHLGMRVLADGIERGEQLDELRALGCAFGQGPYFGVPVPAAEIQDAICGVDAGTLDQGAADGGVDQDIDGGVDQDISSAGPVVRFLA